MPTLSVRLMIDKDLRHRLEAELLRIEEDSIHSSKEQYNAGVRYGDYHLRLGVPAAALSAVAGAASFAGQWELAAGFLSVAVAILASLQTFMKPSERAAAHKSAGDQFLALKNDARVLREVRLAIMPSDLEGTVAVEALAKRRNELNAASPQCSRSDFEKARAGIEAGEATYRVDRTGRTK